MKKLKYLIAFGCLVFGAFYLNAQVSEDPDNGNLDWHEQHEDDGHSHEGHVDGYHSHEGHIENDNFHSEHGVGHDDGHADNGHSHEGHVEGDHPEDKE